MNGCMTFISPSRRGFRLSRVVADLVLNSGYKEIPLFGRYVSDDNTSDSACYEKLL